MLGGGRFIIQEGAWAGDCRRKGIANEEGSSGSADPTRSRLAPIKVVVVHGRVFFLSCHIQRS